jgi:hypothetical protein
MCVPLFKPFSRPLLVALMITTTPASATHAWDSLHWARFTTLNIRLADNVSLAWDPYLAGASADWTKAAPIDTTVIQGTRNPYYCSPTYGRVEVCSYRYGYTGWLGIAQVWTSYGHIVQARVGLNDTYMSTPQYNTPAWHRIVVCQEVGHTFGLDHQDEDKTNLNLGTCMDYTRDPSGTLGTNGTLSNEHPNAHDYDELRIIYNHNDGWQLSSTAPATSGAATSSAAEQLSRSRMSAAVEVPLLNVREWGRAVALDRKGRGRVFFRRFAQGPELTTFVLWTDAEDIARR